ncbi:helix-turn-helix domain-containing protein [Holzapfeliella sp. JNUCC 72]
MNNKYPKYLTYKEALKYINIGSYNTLYKFIDQGLKVLDIGGIKRISQEDIDEFMQKHAKAVEK